MSYKTPFDWYWGPQIILKKTKCKHGDQPCDKCGTTDNDQKHSTRSGEGKVAKLTKTKKRK